MVHPVKDADGHYDPNRVLELVAHALAGAKIGSLSMVERDFEEAYNARLEAEQDGAPIGLDDEPQFGALEYDGLHTPSEQRLFDAHAEAMAVGMDGDAIEALIERAAIRGLSDEEIRAEIHAQSERWRAEGVGQDQREPGDGAPAGAEPLLQAYSEEDVAKRERDRRLAAPRAARNEAAEKPLEGIETEATDKGAKIFEKSGVYLVNGKNTALREPVSPTATGVEAGRRSADVLTADLFAPTGVPAATARAQAEGNFRIHVEQVESRRFKSAITTVNTPEDAAHVLLPLKDRAQEEFLVLVTDTNGKILNLIGHTKGDASSSIVRAGIVAGAVAATDGAANVWIAHNHPSGNPTPSRADENITNTLGSAFFGMGIDYKGHLILGDSVTFIGPGSIYDRSTITPAGGARKRSIPITERVITRRDPRDTIITTTDQAVDALKDMDGSGLLLLDASHAVIGWLQMSPQEMNFLRRNSHAGVRRLLKTLSDTNAEAIIARIDDPSWVAIAQNIATFAKKYDAPLLDVAVMKDGSLVSQAASRAGLPSPGDYLFSNPENPTSAGLSVAQVEAAIGNAVSKVHAAVGLQVQVVADNAALPEDVRSEMRPGQRPHGVVAPSGVVYLIAGNLPDSKAARAVLAHEVVGHVGINEIMEDWPAIQQRVKLLVKAGNTRAKQIDAAVKSRYPDADLTTYTREFIAIAAEQAYSKPIAALLSRVRAAVRQFLVSIGITGVMQDADIDVWLAASAKYLRTGSAGQAGAPRQLAPSFAQADPRAAHRWDVTATANGPVFQNDDILLFPADAPIAGGWAGANGYAVIDQETGRKVAEMVVSLDGDRISDIHWVEAGAKGKGAGRKVVRAILANSDQPVNVSSILDAARGFWDKMGAFNYDEANNAQLEWRAFAKTGSNAGVVPRTAQEASAGGRETGDGGTEGPEGEGSPGGEVGPQFSNPPTVKDKAEQLDPFTAAQARLEPWLENLRYHVQDKFHFLNKAQRALIVTPPPSAVRTKAQPAPRDPSPPRRPAWRALATGRRSVAPPWPRRYAARPLGDSKSRGVKRSRSNAVSRNLRFH